jgi:hypothetical protein
LRSKEILPIWERSHTKHLKPLIWQYSVGQDHVARFQLREDLRHRLSFDDRYESDLPNRMSACKMTRAAAERLAPCPGPSETVPGSVYSNEDERSVEVGPYNGVYYELPRRATNWSMSCNDIDLESNLVHRWYPRDNFPPDLHEVFPSGYKCRYRTEDGLQRDIRVRPLTSSDVSSTRSFSAINDFTSTRSRPSYLMEARSKARQQSMARAGRDPIIPADIEVLFETGRSLFGPLSRSKMLQAPFPSVRRSTLLYATSRRYSETEPNPDCNIRYEIQENPFYNTRTSGRSYRAKIRGEPWKWKRLFFYYGMLLAFQVLSSLWLVFVSVEFELMPVIKIIWSIRDSSLTWSSWSQNTITRMKNALTTSWSYFIYTPRVFAHVIVETYLTGEEISLRRTVFPHLHALLLTLIFSHAICFTLWYVTLFTDDRWRRLNKKRRFKWVVMLILIVLAAPMMLVFCVIMFAENHKRVPGDENSREGNSSQEEDDSNSRVRSASSSFTRPQNGHTQVDHIHANETRGSIPGMRQEEN